MVHGGATLPALRSCWACAQMSSERSPPAPPLPPLLAGEVPAALASVLSACTCGSPEQELLALRDRLWLREGTPQPPHVSFYRYIEPVLQDGPKCGLVALSMASSCTAHPLPVDRLLREARLRGFTNHGEMFSADDMASLARDLLRPCREVEVLRQGLDDREYVVRCVSRGGVLLVPYDADANHSPCCRRGHKAHWAVVSGILVSQRRCHLVARQGKSRHLAVWPYEDLRLSNLNLFELDPARAADGRSYILYIAKSLAS
ncbi:actin maturation protease isoform X2 [Bacillus rossius redtenbacheri]|uniref:actin maturation protease isoform X2 n=1 Tax=Bacillus rossius redtenbacheri TaxID=93214 RepID=UPI002FDD038B